MPPRLPLGLLAAPRKRAPAALPDRVLHGPEATGDALAERRDADLGAFARREGRRKACVRGGIARPPRRLQRRAHLGRKRHERRLDVADEPVYLPILAQIATCVDERLDEAPPDRIHTPSPKIREQPPCPLARAGESVPGRPRRVKARS